MLGSVVDAEDAVQETMVRAWRALPAFDGRSSLRTWLHRIATNACLDALGERTRRSRLGRAPVGTVDDELEVRPRTHWLEPAPGRHGSPAEADPAEKAVLRQRVRLAFVAALEQLPPRQRAALLLTEVLELSAVEVAESLGTSTASVNSALQRARATLAKRTASDDDVPPPLAGAEHALVERYIAASGAQRARAVGRARRAHDVLPRRRAHHPVLEGAGVHVQRTSSRTTRPPAWSSAMSAYAMLVSEAFFKTFTSKEVCNTKTHIEGLFALSCESRAEVDELVAKATGAGGAEAGKTQDHGFMYQRAFYDLDGHHWEVMWMDPSHVK